MTEGIIIALITAGFPTLTTKVWQESFGSLALIGAHLFQITNQFESLSTGAFQLGRDPSTLNISLIERG